MKELLFPFLSPLMAFLLAGLFVLTTYLFVAKRKKLTFSDIFLFIFWIVCVISFALIGILLTAFYYFNLSLEAARPFLILILICWFFQYFFIFLYCLSRIISKKWLLGTFGFLFLIFWASVFSPLLSQSRVILRYREPFLIFPGQSAVIYSTGFLALGLILFYFFIIWRDIKLGFISWSNLSLLYLHYSIIVFAAITFIRVFYFFPHPHIIMIFYSLIPYLVYLSRKDELRQK